jgi:hypothetical protein
MAINVVNSFNTIKAHIIKRKLYFYSALIYVKCLFIKEIETVNYSKSSALQYSGQKTPVFDTQLILLIG